MCVALGKKCAALEVHRRILATKEACQGSNEDPRYQEKDERGLTSIYGSVKSESSHIKGVPSMLRISTFMHGHGHPELAKKLNDKITRTMDKIFERVRAFIRGEAAAGSAEIARAL
ncbi:hypothetical protein Tco_1154973 [Tanacetum coccineum]